MATYDLTNSIPSPSTLLKGDVLNCPYSGTYKQITLPAGTYLLECWGASGGYNTNSNAAGKGGYSAGTLILSTNTILYLYTGGQGAAQTTNGSTVSGGFNGGGDAKASAWGRSSGGGASDIRLSTSLYSRIIVAGGGGGSTGKTNGMATEYDTSVGHGGGTSGVSGDAISGTSQGLGSGGTQTSAGTNSTTTDADGAFGIGGSYGSGTCAGGGGGWYGGAAGSGAGGGSGYVYTSSTASNYPVGCELNSNYYLTSASTTVGNQSFTSPTGTTETGHLGNGYVRITVANLFGPTTYEIPGDTLPSSFSIGDIINCSYSGTYQVISLPTGNYFLECWGAQGGGLQNNSSLETATGGKGGYSYGILSLSATTTFYLYVGGMGQSAGGALATGGFNGGGTAYGSSTSEPANGGGGASDIRISSDSLYSRVIVAGGGGGAGEDVADTPGAGGGTSGLRSTGGNFGGTQTAATGGGAFGYGANTPNDGGGGGGGWYGGGTVNGSQTIPTSNSTSDTSGGCGGSGYVYTSSTASNYPSGCTLNSNYYLIAAETIAGDQSFNDPNGTSEIGHSGNGYIRITVIDPNKISVPKPTGNTLTFNNTNQSYSINHFDSSLMNISGDLTGTNIGTYTVIISLKDTSNYCWMDGTTSNLTVNWYIQKLSLTKPSSSSRTYNGSSQSYALTNFNSTYMNISGTLSAIDVGTYSVVVSLKDTNNTQWSDGTIGDLSRTWSINKITSYFTPLSPQNKIIMGHTTYLYVGVVGDGVFSASSSDISIYTVSATVYTGYAIIEINPIATGTAILTTSITAGTNYSGLSKTVSLTVLADTNQAISSLSIGESNLYYYSGTEESIVIPAGYTVQLECWGAAGNFTSPDTASNIGNGADGGYATGILPSANVDRTLYMHIGGMGSAMVGGWNGGGGQIFTSGFTITSTKDTGAGGGATDISLVSTPSFIFDNFRFLQSEAGYKSRIIVAGGGGAIRSTTATAIGGYAPSTITTTTNASAACMTGTGTTAGTQAAAPGFGYGGTAGYNSSDDRAGAGGGWYGGSNHTDSSAGGGSSFVWSDDHASYIPVGYIPDNSYKLTNIECIQGNTSHPSPTSNGTTVTTQKYNGYIRITVINIETTAKTPVIKPTGGIAYWNGSVQNYILNNFDSSLMNISGDLTGTAIGTYTVIVSLKNTSVYCWEDNTISPLTITWQIIDGQLKIYTKINNSTWKQSNQILIKTNSSTWNNNIVTAYIKTVNGWKEIQKG